MDTIPTVIPLIGIILMLLVVGVTIENSIRKIVKALEDINATINKR